MTNIRKFKNADLPQFLALYNEWNRTSITNRQMGNVIKLSTKNVIVLAFENLKLVGYLIESLGPDIEEGGVRAEITDLFVQKMFRNKGIATALNKRAVHTAKNAGAPKVSLETEVDFKEAHALYTKLGFKKTRIIVFHKRLSKH
jgi:ribosomal protein S18 acetylase RimI-like enzyme